MGDTLFTTSLAGEEIVRLQTWGTGDRRLGDYLQGSPCTMLDIPQPLMEPMLIKNAAERGAIVSFNTEYLDHEQDADGRDRARSATCAPVTCSPSARATCSAFDGARSTDRRADRPAVRGRAGPGRHRLHPVQRRPEPVRRAPAEHPALDLQLERRLRRDRHGPAARHPPWNEWIAGWGFDMANGEPDLVRRRRARADPHPGRRPRPRGRDRDASRSGTSTSSTPPTTRSGGCSAAATPCTGTRRAAAWARTPPCRTRSTWPGRSRSWSRATPARACSTPTPPSGRRSASRSSPGPTSPARTTPACGSGSTTTATTRSRDGLAKLKEASPEGVALRERLYEALELKNTEFNAHGVELNQRYESGAVLPDPAVGEEEWPRHRELYLQATTRPGAKLPHAWLVGAGRARASRPSTSPARAR